MAKNEQKSLQLEDSWSKLDQKMEKKLKDAQKKAELAEKKAELEDQKKELQSQLAYFAQQLVESEKECGEEHFKTQMLRSFYDVLFNLQEVVTIISDVALAMNVISSTMEIIDGSFDSCMNAIGSMFNVDVNKRYGFLARVKNNYKIRKATSNVRNRLKGIGSTIKNINGMTNGLLKAFSKFGKDIGKSFKKRNSKNIKVDATAERSEKYLQKVRDEYDKTHSTDTSASPADSSGNSSNPGNIDDITFM